MMSSGIVSNQTNVATGKPLALRMIKCLLILPFVIYIPVSIYRTDVFLFLLDIFLLIGLIVTFLDPARMRWVFGGKKGILVLTLLYIGAVLFRVFLDIGYIDTSMMTAIRNLLYGLFFFMLSSAWINTQERVDQVVKILLIGSILTALYGIRQLIFGFTDFELERLAKMGSSLKEMDVLGRKRITSGFGDPLTFSFFMMIGVLIYLIARQRKIFPFITQKCHPYSVLIIFFALVLTLTRAPLLGLMSGIVLYSILTIKITQRLIFRVFGFIIAVVLFIFSLDKLVQSRILANSDNSLFVSIHMGLESFWTLFQLTQGNNIDPAMYFLVSQSKDARSNAWGEGVEALFKNPLGDGFSGKTSYSFAVTDVGVLRQGLELGLWGILSIVVLLIVIGIVAFFDIRVLPSFQARKQGYFFLATWLAIFIVSGISSILETSVISIVIWTIAAILVNQRKIYNSTV